MTEKQVVKQWLVKLWGWFKRIVAKVGPVIAWRIIKWLWGWLSEDL